MWLAALLGLCGGILASYAIGKATVARLIERCSDHLLAAKCALAGCLVAMLPAVLLSLTAGTTLGNIWGERTLQSIGMGPGGGALGAAIGVTVVFAVVLLSGTLLGVGIAFFIERKRDRGVE